MITPELITYIQKSLARGISEQKIRETLSTQGGWTVSDLETAFNKIKNLQNGSIQETVSASISTSDNLNPIASQANIQPLINNSVASSSFSNPLSVERPSVFQSEQTVTSNITSPSTTIPTQSTISSETLNSQTISTLQTGQSNSFQKPITPFVTYSNQQYGTNIQKSITPLNNLVANGTASLPNTPSQSFTPITPPPHEGTSKTLIVIIVLLVLGFGGYIGYGYIIHNPNPTGFALMIQNMLKKNTDNSIVPQSPTTTDLEQNTSNPPTDIVDPLTGETITPTDSSASLSGELIIPVDPTITTSPQNESLSLSKDTIPISTKTPPIPEPVKTISKDSFTILSKSLIEYSGLIASDMYSKKKTFVGFCKSPEFIKIQNSYKELSLSTTIESSSIHCKDSKTEWAVSGTVAKNDYWCIDSTGITLDSDGAESQTFCDI